MKIRSIVICADDFGLHAGVNAACIDLAERGRLSAVSCLAGGPAWRGARAEIGRLASLPVDLGLHLDFTEFPLGKGVGHSLNGLIALAYTRRLRDAQIVAEIHAQLDAFEAVAGRPPDHVDGHQHVHQLPMIREALLRTLEQRYCPHKPWIRNTAALGATGTPRLKAMVIAGMGRGALAGLAKARHFPQNLRLGGVYGFQATQETYKELLRRWFDAFETGDVLMCHPGSGNFPGDTIGGARSTEFAVLGSNWFGEQLAGAGMTVGRLLSTE